MSDAGVSFDLGSLAEFGYRRLQEWFGADPTTQEERVFIQRLIGIAAQESSLVQCVGMQNPIPIQDIYQTTRLRNEEIVKDFRSVLFEGDNGVIYARPGQGKTTLLRWAFIELLKEGKNWRPFLFTLRNQEAIQDLTRFVDLIGSRSKAVDRKKGRIALFCDGYDEISTDERKQVSQTLRRFSALDCGNYFVTCRMFYDVYGLPARQYEIDNFTRSDAERFVQAFSKHYNFSIPAKDFLDELCTRGFSSFAEHPLLLTLVCLLQSGPKSKLPPNGIGLLRRSFECMRYRWDKEKGVERESTVPLDGEEHEHILRKVAFAMDSDQISDARVRKITEGHLKLLQYKYVNKSRLLMEGEVKKLLLEIAQFYGLLVPTKSSYWGAEPQLRWEFTHNTVRDFLAASHWHQELRFDPLKVNDWNLRAAYAACMLGNATVAIETCLDRRPEVFAVSECLINGARFDSSRIAMAVIRHFVKYDLRFKQTIEPDRVRFETDQDLFAYCNDELIRNLLRSALELSPRSPAIDLCLFYALSEVKRRQLKFSDTIRETLKSRLPSLSSPILVRRRDGWDILSSKFFSDVTDT